MAEKMADKVVVIDAECEVEKSKNSVEQLMQGPLVAWVRTFREENSGLDYTKLVNGAFLDGVLSRV